MSESKIFTLFVNCYSLKFSKTNSIISVSIPGHGFSFHESDNVLHTDLIKYLKKLFWSDIAITNLQKFLFSQSWKTNLHINIKSGKIY